jgi:hypothetical protein
MNEYLIFFPAPLPPNPPKGGLVLEYQQNFLIERGQTPL